MDGVLLLQGSAAVGEGLAIADTLLVYVLDVSGSVNESGQGCGGDANGDGRADTVLDCEIAAAMAVNAEAVAVGSVGEVGVVAFSGYSRFVSNPPVAAVAGDVNPASGVQILTTPGADLDGAGGPDVDEVLKSAVAQNFGSSPAYGFRRFTPLAAGGGFTNYHDGVAAALQVVNAGTLPNKVVIFMSDGASTVGAPLDNLRAAVEASGAVIHTFAVGSDTGFSCDTDSNGFGSLTAVARLSEPDGLCTEVGTVADLPTVVPELILSELTGLSVNIDGGPAQDISAAAGLPLPQTGPVSVQFTTQISLPAAGVHALCVTAAGSDAGGTGTVSDCVDFVVNGAPVSAEDVFTTTEDLPLSQPAPGVLANDLDPNGDVPTAVLVTPPAHGELRLNMDGSFTYTPNRHFAGADAFVYQAVDPSGATSALTTVTLTVTPDAFLEVTNLCDHGPGSLRAAMEAANAMPTQDTIIFDIIDSSCGLDGTIVLDSPLPAITTPLVIDATLRDDGAAQTVIITLNGGEIDGYADGLVISASGAGSEIVGLTIRNFSGSGIVIGASGAPSDGNRITGNTLTANDGDGVTIFAGVNNVIRGNNIYANGDLDIDLGGDGRTPNDQDDLDDGANFVQNYPVLFRATPAAGDTLFIEGWLDTQPNQSYTLQFFAARTCNDLQSVLPLTPGTETVLTDENGEVYFQKSSAQPAPLGWAIRATATDAAGNTSELSDCILASVDNDSWPRALSLPSVAGVQAAATTADQSWTVDDQYLDQFGQSRWYRFPVTPDSEILVTLSNLPANYDLTLYRDISAVYADLVAPEDVDDLHRLSAEFAPSAFSPSAFSPSAFSPSAFSPSAFSPSAFSPSAFSPSAFSPSAFSPSAFSPSAFSPSAFSPSAFSPSAFSPSAFSPSAFSPSAFSPSAFSPEAFSSAQMRSLIGVSAIDGTAAEQLRANTWTNTGDFYVRVRGREGAFDQSSPFQLTVTVTPSNCDITPFAGLPPSDYPVTTDDYKTLILTDLARIDESDAMMTALTELAQRENGVIVNVDEDARVREANRITDGQLVTCPYAKNVVADAVKQVIDRFWDANPDHLRYIVLVGNDDVIPFYRYPDTALLGDESNYFPPVQDNTASQASLRRSYVLSQDAYGADITLALNGTVLPVPKLAVGRLVETPADIAHLVTTYLNTPGGIVPTPTSALVTGYDFLEDAALAVKRELEAGMGDNVVADSLITPADQSPLAPTIAEGGSVWTAADLDAKLRQNSYDLLFLAGHFNANSALAADYSTSLISQDVLDFGADMTNAIVFSVGCHSGYNIVNEHGIPGVTFEPDWAQVFAQKGATFIGGTGYQYGDTEFLEYSERLYLEFVRQLRTGTGAVAVGEALVRAKQRYLETTPALRGIHEKSLLETTLFGLPMLSVDMPGARITPEQSAGLTPAPVTTAPGATLGLHTTSLNATTTLADRTAELTNVESPGDKVQVRWLEGRDGIVTNAAEPTLPLEVYNASATQPELALRGVGLWRARYTDMFDIIPYTGAPTTEIRGVHSPFFSDVFFPLRLWNVNYFGELTGTESGTTLALTPAQHKSTFPGAETNTLRRYSDLELRLYYSGNVVREAVDGDPTAVSSPGASAPPTIVSVSSALVSTNVVSFTVRVVGNPAAGIQDVWVTYTGLEGSPFYGAWESVSLEQQTLDTTLWTGTLVLTTGNAADLRFMVQAANGVGLTTVADNLGRTYRVGGSGPVTVTTLALEPYATTGAFGTKGQFAATLRDSSGLPLPGQVVYIAAGVQEQVALTDEFGTARVEIPLLGRPGLYKVRATFPGTVDLAAASDDGETPFAVMPQETTLCLDTDLDGDCDADDAGVGRVFAGPVRVAAILADVNDSPRRQIEQTVLFTITGSSGVQVIPAITDFIGRAFMPPQTLDPGDYTVVAAFPGTEALIGTMTAAPFTLTVAANQPPNCADAYAQPAALWPPNGKFVPITILGVTDPEGGPVSIQVENVCQDEPVGNQGDAVIVDGDAQVRAERLGRGDGRAYQVDFTATDGLGATCAGSVTVAVVHDQGDVTSAIGEFAYNSVDPAAPPACSSVGEGNGTSLRMYSVNLPLIVADR